MGTSLLLPGQLGTAFVLWGRGWVSADLGGRAEFILPDSSWQDRGSQGLAFSSQNLAQDGDPGCSDSLAGGWKVWLGRGAVPERNCQLFILKEK